jgi:hypothetical protein
VKYIRCIFCGGNVGCQAGDVRSVRRIKDSLDKNGDEGKGSFLNEQGLLQMVQPMEIFFAINANP